VTTAGLPVAACPAPAAVDAVPRAARGTGAELLARFPPRPVCSSWPAARAGRPEVFARLLAPPFALGDPLSQQPRRLGLIAVVTWLEAQPGESWQDRWRASGAEDQQDWRGLVAAWKAARAGASPGCLPPHIGGGLMLLICGDVIRPGTGWLLRCSPTPRNLAAEMARTRDGTAFAELTALCQDASVGSYARLAALDKIAVIMAAKGGLAADITVGDCAKLLGIAEQVRTGTDRHSSSPFFYQLLRAWGAFGEDAPATMRVFVGRGEAHLRAADRPLPHPMPPGPRRAGGLPARTPGGNGLLLPAAPCLHARQAVLGRHRSPPPGDHLAQAPPRRRRRVEAAGDDPDQDPDRPGRRAGHHDVGPP